MTDLHDQILEQRLRTACREVIPQLAPADTSAPAGGAELVPSDQLGRRRSPLVDVRSPERRPRRHLARPLAISMTAAAAIAGLVIVVSRPEPAGPASGALPPATGQAPTWYQQLRPLVPEWFGYLAVTSSGSDRATYVAIDATTGKALEISLSASAGSSDASGTSDAAGSWTETAQGWTVNTPKGDRIEVTCDIGAKGRDFPGPPNYCDMASTGPFSSDQIKTVATALAAPGVVKALRASTLVSTVPQSQIQTLIAAAIPDQHLIGDTDWGTGDHVWDFAVSDARPDTSVRVIANVYPAPPQRVGPNGALYDDAGAIWVVDPTGLAVRISTTNPTPDNFDTMQALAVSVADRASGATPSVVTPTTTHLGTTSSP